MNDIKNVALVLIVCMSQSACQSFGPQVKRPLTPKEKAVKVVKSGQNTSLKLFNKCKDRNKLETFYSIDDARIRAVELGANTAQIIYATSYNGGADAYDIKFWLCK